MQCWHRPYEESDTCHWDSATDCGKTVHITLLLNALAALISMDAAASEIQPTRNIKYNAWSLEGREQEKET